MSSEETWVRDLRSVQKSILTILRDAFRTDFAQASAMLRVSNTRVATRLAQMSIGDIERLAEHLGPNLVIKLDDSMALEVLLERVLDGAGDIEIGMSRMAAAATSHEAPN
jgi:DNA-binding Lrp family transcriptional regulator